MFLLRLAILAVISALAPGAFAEDDNTLYVHIIPHSHCDPGWLDTFEQYYRRDVNRILTGVMNRSPMPNQGAEVADEEVCTREKVCAVVHRIRFIEARNDPVDCRLKLG